MATFTGDAAKRAFMLVRMQLLGMSVPENAADEMDGQEDIELPEVTVTGRKKGKFWKSALNIFQTALDVIGFVPVVGEVADGLSASAMIPGVGAAATGVKWGRKGFKALEATEKLGSVGKGLGSEMKLLGTTRDNLLSAVENSKLRNIVNDLYRPGAKVGGGSSMDAFRLEQLTGGTVGGKTHTTKLLNYRKALQRVWNNKANLSAGDRQIVKQLLGDIQNALSGY